MAIRSSLLPLALLVLAAASSAAVAQLEIGFYSKTCPDAEKIVGEEMAKIIAAAPSLAGPLLRLHFHDCFVRGCDASVLLESTDGNVAEKDAKPNKSLRGFGSVERVKAKLEAACPGIVSCADVLTLMSRDAVVMAKGPFWPVALGRRDGRMSSATEASNELPPAPRRVPLLAKIFASKGLDLKDLVVLSVSDNTSGENVAYGVVDPSLDSEYADKLRLKCKSVDDRTMLSEMDPGSFKTFDTSYYRHVAKRRGLFRSDSALLLDATTMDYVQRIATGKFDSEFFRDFSESMIKMGDVGVLTGAGGEIRKKCYAPN
uniref:Peroxidase n=1 Tax=Aegilops tauschii TaxID=37682 RepID=M8CDS8_AEGTA